MLDEARAIGELVRRARRDPARARPQRRTGDRRRGRAPQRRDHRPRRPAAASDRARRRAVFGETVDYVLKHAPCRVIVVTAAREAPREPLLGARSASSRSCSSRSASRSSSARPPPAVGGGRATSLGALFVALGAGRLYARAQAACADGAKLRGFERVLDAPSLSSVAYGEIALLALLRARDRRAHALGLTPLVLLAVGRALPPRRALVRRGHGRDPRDRAAPRRSSAARSTTSPAS